MQVDKTSFALNVDIDRKICEKNGGFCPVQTIIKSIKLNFYKKLIRRVLIWNSTNNINDAIKEKDKKVFRCNN